ncbi:MAG: ComEC/Rec2 family competence protein [Clostridia bacterium]|nr:ComEC/Rec2 family competence protein [Clostridia bacterium]
MPRPFAVIGFTVFFTIALLYNSDTGAIAGVLLAFAAALVISLFVTEARNQRVLPCAFASGILACILLIAEINFHYLPAVEYDGKTCGMTVQLTDYPEHRYGNYYFNAKALEIDGEESRLKIRLVFSSLPDAEPYDTLEGDFTFYVLGSSSEDYLASNKARGVFIGAYPMNGEYTVNNISEKEKPFAKRVVDVREAIKKSVSRAVTGDSGALATALLIGDKSDMSPDILNYFRMSGITHIICVSGFHLSLWAMVILEILKFFRVNERIASIIAVLGVVAFMLVAGMTYSVIRSGVMMLLYLLANVLWKNRDSLNSLGFSLVVIALYNPFAMGSVGLQLSALSTFGLILYLQYVKPKIKQKFDKISNSYFAEIADSLINAAMIPAAATAFTLPISMGLYDEFNFAVILSNIVAVPIAFVCIISGALAGVSAKIFESSINIFSHVAQAFGDFLISIARVFSRFDLLTFRADEDSHRILICGIFLIVAVAVLMAYSGKNLYKFACMLCAVIFTTGLIFSSVSRDSETRLNVIDVGNGTAVIVSKNGENLLFGCGGTEFLGAERISEEIKHCGYKINYLFIPDSDENASGYLNDILLEYRPEKIYCGDLPSGSDLLLKRTDIYDFGIHAQTENFSVKSITVEKSDCAYLESSDMSALICFDPSFDYSLLPSEVKAADVIISRNDYPDNIENPNCRLLVLNAENGRGIIIQDELSDYGVRCAATGGCGNILIRGENGCVSANRN